MGQNQSNNKNQAISKREKDPKLSDDDCDDDYEGKVAAEAQTYVVAKVRYEKPNGESEEREFRVNTSTTKAEVLKRRLEKQFGITKNKIQVYLEHGKQEMPDEATLFDLGIIDDIALIVRDGSDTQK